MTPNQIVTARAAIQELSRVVLPYKTARQVARLKRRIDEEFEVVTSMEKAIVEEFGGSMEGLRRKFPDESTAVAFDEKMRLYMEEETEIKLPTVDLSKYAENIRISPATIDALDGLVKWEAKSDG